MVKLLRKWNTEQKNGDNSCCIPDHDKTEVLLAIKKAKEATTISNEPLTRSYKKAVEPLHRNCLNLVTPVTSFSSKKRNEYKKKRRFSDKQNIILGRLRQISSFVISRLYKRNGKREKNSDLFGGSTNKDSSY